MPSRDPEDLEPATRYRHDLWEHGCREAGIDVLTTCTYRSQAEQNALWEQGRDKPGKIVTWTRRSRHSETMPDGKPGSTAWDFVPLVSGKPVWKDTDPLWQRACDIARGIEGLECGADWPKRKRDLPHIQLRRAT